jgi:L-alanine-DL-glutamate epimerase-like enolase superfamily enzyme
VTTTPVPGETIRSIETFIRGRLGIVRVRATDGAEGLGQLAPTNVDIAATVLHRHVAPYTLGRDGGDTEGLMQGCLDGEAKFVGSYLARALAGVDTALWDLRGKRERKGVCELAGGEPRAVRVYGSSRTRRGVPEELAQELVREREAHGYSAFKVKIGKRRGRDADQWPGRTPALVASARAALGDGVELLADANSCYRPERAIEVGRLLERHGFRQFEEPCPHNELEWTARVADALDLEVAGGEQDHDLAQFRRMFALRAVDVVQPDVCYVGGFTQALRVGALAAEAGIPCQPHASNRSLVMVFGLHLIAAAALPGAFVECALNPPAWAEGVFDPPIAPVAGHVRVPEGPGWGVDIDPAWLRTATRQASETESRAVGFARAAARAGRKVVRRAGRGPGPPSPQRVR